MAVTPIPATRPSSSRISKRDFMAGSLLPFGNPDHVAAVTAWHRCRWHSDGMTEEQVRELVATAIREHELRVAVISGVLGSVLLAGSWHALWLLRSWVL
jgi:hypothetical protein